MIKKNETGAEAREEKSVGGRDILLRDINSDDTIKKLMAVLPKHMKPEFFVRVVINQLNKYPKLAICSRQSFIGSILDLAAIGLEPDGRKAHLIPYGKVCTYQLDYKGIAELVMRSGLVSHVAADVIRPGDIIRWNKGQLLEHVPHFLRTDAAKPEVAGDPFAAYSLVVFKDGNERAEVMSKEDILAIRDESQGWKAHIERKNQTPWDPSHPHKAYEMWKKTVFKRLSKWLPLSAEVQHALEDEDSRDYPSHSQVNDIAREVVSAPSSRSIRPGDSSLAEELRSQSRSAKAAVEEFEIDDAEFSVNESEELDIQPLLLELKNADDPIVIMDIERELVNVSEADKPVLMQAIESAKARF